MSSNRYVPGAPVAASCTYTRICPVSVFALVGMLLVAVAMSDQIAAATNDRRGRSAAQVAADTPILISGVRGTPADSSGNTTASVAVGRQWSFEPRERSRSRRAPATASTMTPRPPGCCFHHEVSFSVRHRGGDRHCDCYVDGLRSRRRHRCPTTTVTTTTTAPSGAQEGLVRSVRV
jgi:hypothetical protein